MNQPQGFVEVGQERKVCTLNKFVQDLEKAPKQLYQKFNFYMIENGYNPNENDKGIYYKSQENSLVLVNLYVVICNTHDGELREDQRKEKEKSTQVTWFDNILRSRESGRCISLYEIVLY